MSAKKFIDDSELVRRYLSGETPHQLAMSLGVGRNLILRHLTAHGTELRTRSEAERLKWSLVTVRQDTSVTLVRNCEYCGQEFARKVWPSQNKSDRHRFCSRRCSRLGTPASDEAKVNMAVSGVARWARVGEREKLSSTLVDFFSDSINHAERVALIHKNWASPEAHIKASFSAKRPEAVKARQEGLNRCRANSEWFSAYTRMMSERMLTPEIRVKCSRSAKAWWQRLTKEQHADKVRRMFEGRVHYMQSRQTNIERAVGSVLSDLRINAIPQYPVDRCLLDFYLPDLGAAIECDGDYWHSLPGARRRDQKRDNWLQSHGFIVVRIEEREINKDCNQAVLNALAIVDRVIKIRMSRVAS